MKTRVLLAVMLLMANAYMMAENYLTITYNGKEQNISLPIVKRIYFENDRVRVTTADGEHSYPISLVDKISFTESTTAIEALPEQQEGLTYKDGTLAIKGDGFLRVFSSNGALVSIANVKEGANVSLDNLPAGIYIVRMGDKTIKVRK